MIESMRIHTIYTIQDGTTSLAIVIESHIHYITMIEYGKNAKSISA